MASFKIVFNGLTKHRINFESYPSDDSNLKIIRFEIQATSYKDLPHNITNEKNLDIHVYIKFNNDLIEDSFFEIDDPDYALIPKQIKKLVLKISPSLISFIDNTIFHISMISTIKVNNSLNAVSDWIVTINSEINQYISQLNEQYLNYLKNPHEWIMNNLPNKKDSLFFIWKIQKNCKMVFIDIDEFERITNCEDTQNFAPFVIMILDGENDKYEIRLISEESQEKLNYYSFFVSYLTPIGEVLEKFESWVKNGPIPKNQNFFIERVKESRKIDFILRYYNE